MPLDIRCHVVALLPRHARAYVDAARCHIYAVMMPPPPLPMMQHDCLPAAFYLSMPCFFEVCQRSARHVAFALHVTIFAPPFSPAADTDILMLFQRCVTRCFRLCHAAVYAMPPLPQR